MIYRARLELQINCTQHIMRDTRFHHIDKHYDGISYCYPVRIQHVGLPLSTIIATTKDELKNIVRDT